MKSSRGIALVCLVVLLGAAEFGAARASGPEADVAFHHAVGTKTASKVNSANKNARASQPADQFLAKVPGYNTVPEPVKIFLKAMYLGLVKPNGDGSLRPGFQTQIQRAVHPKWKGDFVVDWPEPSRHASAQHINVPKIPEERYSLAFFLKKVVQLRFKELRYTPSRIQTQSSGMIVVNCWVQGQVIGENNPPLGTAMSLEFVMREGKVFRTRQRPISLIRFAGASRN